MARAKRIEDYSPIRQRFKELVQHQFEDFWKWSRPREREILKGLTSDKYEEVGEQLKSWIEERESLIRRGLILRREDGSYTFLSSAFWEWLIDNLYRLEEIRKPRSPELSHLQQQLRDHLRRKNILEEQVAKFGTLNAPPHKITQIEDAKATIATLEAKIAKG